MYLNDVLMLLFCNTIAPWFECFSRKNTTHTLSHFLFSGSLQYTDGGQYSVPPSPAAGQQPLSPGFGQKPNLTRGNSFSQASNSGQPSGECGCGGACCVPCVKNKWLSDCV